MHNYLLIIIYQEIITHDNIHTLRGKMNIKRD